MILYVIAEIENETDQQFMLQLYEAYNPIMFKIARKYVSDVYAVEDLVQESLVRLIPKISTLRELSRCKLDAYIVYTVRNTAFNFLRKKAKERQNISFEDMDTLIHELSTAERCVEFQYAESEKKAQLNRVLRKLPEKDQEVLVRKYYLQQSDQEIATAYGCKSSSIRMVLTRVRRRVFAILNEEGIVYEIS